MTNTGPDTVPKSMKFDGFLLLGDDEPDWRVGSLVLLADGSGRIVEVEKGPYYNPIFEQYMVKYKKAPVE